MQTNMDQNIYVKMYTDTLPVNDREIWRYAGFMGVPDAADESLNSLLCEVKNELANTFTYKVCYRRLPITWEDGMPVLPMECDSKNLATCLKGSSEIVMFAATIGPGIDTKINVNQRFNQTKALLMQAYGAERVESLCDRFCEDLKKEFSMEGYGVTNRFSPGYGDMPLSHQKDFFRILDISHKIGISLGDSLLMRPSKSVTAIFGLKKGMENVCESTQTKCEQCSNVNCDFRRTE